MLTYQDLLEIGQDETDRMNFVRSVINDHKASPAYDMAVEGYEYDHKRNTTIINYEKTLHTLTGGEVPDIWSPNHKTVRNFFNYFTTQQNQYLLGNGVTWQDDSTAEKLGDDFDIKLQQAGKIALTQGESFGFFNLDHLEVFELREFAPLYDEENGSLRAGVRFWQISGFKPLRATLYEEDGYTSYIWNERDANGKLKGDGRVYEEKKKYIIKTKTSEIDGTIIYAGENYPTFPIVPLWGNPLHQSELVGIQEQIDAYDLIKNGFLNDLDTAQLYWVIKGAGGMDDPDLAQFMERIKRTHFASMESDQDVHPITVDIPYNARETLLSRLERDLFKDYGALNVDEIRGGAVTATQIMAAYEPLNVKADQYEYCIHDFLDGILKVAGIEDEKPTFTRSKLVNVAEEVQTVLQAGNVFDEDYLTRKILTLLGDGDQADEILERKAADELAMSGMGGMGGMMPGMSPISGSIAPMGDAMGANGGFNGDAGEIVEDAEKAAGKPLNGAQTASLITILKQFKDGILTEGQAIKLMTAALGISREDAEEILKG